MSERAADAFDRNGFLAPIDANQAEGFDEEFILKHGVQVSFIKLTLLVGG